MRLVSNPDLPKPALLEHSHSLIAIGCGVESGTTSSGNVLFVFVRGAPCFDWPAVTYVCVSQQDCEDRCV